MMSNNRTTPMVTQNLTRKQFSQIVFPSALLLLAFVAYSLLRHVFALDLNTKELPIDAIIFCVSWALLMVSFLRGAFTSPGLVEKGWYRRYPTMYEVLKQKYKQYEQQTQQQQQWMKRFNNKEKETIVPINDELNEDDDDAEQELIFPENFARPPRSHYCHELQSNVLRMDHWCVWFNNAVGFHNYKFFVLTIGYLWLSSLLALLIIVYRLFVQSFVPIEYGVVNTLCLLLSFMICSFFAVFASMHCAMHVWQMSKNLTSIEYHKFAQIKAMAHHFQIDFPDTHEFDHGVFENCTKMMGADVWLWLIPTSPSFRCQGYQFAINAENKAKIENASQAIQNAREQLWAKHKLIPKSQSTE